MMEGITRFEERLMMHTSIILAVIMPLITIVNIMIKVDTMVVVLSGLNAFYFIFLIILGKKYKKFYLLRILLTVYGMIFLNSNWYYNSGSKGPTLIIFVVFLSLLVFIWDRKALIFIASTYFLNLFILFLIEYNDPGLTGDYHSEYSRLMDIYICTAVAFIFILTFALYAKNSYVEQYRMARKSDQLKTTFLANMSHEVRSPLNAISGFSALLSRSNSEEKKEKHIKIIQSNSEYLTNLIKDMFDISLIECDQLRVEKKSFGIRDTLMAIQAEANREIKSTNKKNLEIICTEPEVPGDIFSDPVRIKQVLVNLVFNAIKFTQNGSISFGYEIEQKYFKFFVKDTGLGIKEENISHVFDRFFKIDNPEDIFYRGTGLGLHLCKKIVDILGGTIWVESVFGKGTSFYFTIPR